MHAGGASSRVQRERSETVNLEEQARMLGNRVRKNFRRLHPRFEARRIGAFRIYDRDIPEIRAAVDWYEGHLVVAEYAREQTEGIPWLQTMAGAVADALEVPRDRVFLKMRRAGEQYARLARRNQRIAVREGDLRFLVNLDDYIDTGLFADHRETRARVRAEARGQRFLNLFAYTGSFTCAAALGGAVESTSVDASQTYLDWARDNLAENGFTSYAPASALRPSRAEPAPPHPPAHALVRADVGSFLRNAGSRRFTLCVLDPPSWSDRETSFDVQRDHRDLIDRTLALLEPGGVLWFSTNHQRFTPRLEGLRFTEEQTVPEDYRNRTAHRAFRITK
jgi:23S rRNA (cytosine1962-C5)-methyltransferase